MTERYSLFRRFKCHFTKRYNLDRCSNLRCVTCYCHFRYICDAAESDASNEVIMVVPFGSDCILFSRVF